MKSKILVAALLMTATVASAQTEKTVPVTKTSELAYTVAPDGKTKDGAYTLKNLKNKGVWAQGYFKANERSGTWYFFNAKSALTMRYSYDQKKLLFLDTKSLENVSVKVLSDDASTASAASAPLPLCPVDFYTTLIGSTIANNYKDPANSGLTAEIIAHVDTYGKATYTVAYIDGDKKTEAKLIELPSTFQIDWLPSKLNDKAYNSEFTIYAKISGDGEAEEHRRFKWNN